MRYWFEQQSAFIKLFSVYWTRSVKWVVKASLAIIIDLLTFVKRLKVEMNSKQSFGIFSYRITLHFF